MRVDNDSFSLRQPGFPPCVRINGRLYNWRSRLEWFKAALAAYALGQEPSPFPTTRPEGDSLVPAKVAASELGVGRRTIGRYIKIAEQRGDDAEPEASRGAAVETEAA